MTRLEKLRLTIGLWIMPTWAARIINEGLLCRRVVEAALGETE